MAKDNLFLGTARGSVGDVTFSRLNGLQVARVRNRSPRNPQSPAQMVQRIIMSTVGKAYSFMSEICDHSFEGFESGQLSQRKFMEVNIGLLRDKVADILSYPIEESILSSTANNFSFKNDYAPVFNGYMLSAGSLPSIQLAPLEGSYFPCIEFDPGELTTANITYNDIVSLLGLQRGDQLTFIQVAHDGSKTEHDRDILTGFRFARVILEPSDGDMSSTFLSNGQINKPNEKNAGRFSVLYVQTSETIKGLRFSLADITQSSDSGPLDRLLAGSAVILSRQVGGRWLRSTQFLMPRYAPGLTGLSSSTIALAYETYRLGSASDLYLNQAE